MFFFGGGVQIPFRATSFTCPLPSNSRVKNFFNPIKKAEQPKHARAVRDEVFFFFFLFARTSAMLSFVLAQLLSPLPRFSVPVQFTPYNSLKVFDISKPSGPGVADVAGFVATEAVIVSASALHRGAVLIRCSGLLLLLPFACFDTKLSYDQTQFIYLFFKSGSNAPHSSRLCMLIGAPRDKNNPLSLFLIN